MLGGDEHRRSKVSGWPSDDERDRVEPEADNVDVKPILLGVEDRRLLLTLVIEVTGEAKKEKQAKVATAEHLWTVAVNNWAVSAAGPSSR